MKTLSHLNARGEARMVDVGAKPVTAREAAARAEVRMAPGTVRLLAAGGLPKGDAFAAARLAGILAAKRTDELIPLCHSLPISSVEVQFKMRRNGVVIDTRVRLEGRTGVEMEALVAASVAALTLYDMAKAVDKGIVIGPVYLVSKTGGKSDLRFPLPLKRDRVVGDRVRARLKLGAAFPNTGSSLIRPAGTFSRSSGRRKKIG